MGKGQRGWDLGMGIVEGGGKRLEDGRKEVGRWVEKNMEEKGKEVSSFKLAWNRILYKLTIIIVLP